MNTNHTPSKIEAARMFILAFDADSLPIWLNATKIWADRKGTDALWTAVENMRSLWYHDGSVAAKTKLHIARDAVAVLAKACTCGHDGKLTSADCPLHGAPQGRSK